MTTPDAFLSDHEWRLKMAAEGKAIYIPGKTPKQIAAERMREQDRLARKSSRTIALTVEEWRTIDTAIPDVIELLDDVRSVLSGLAYMDDLDRPAVNSMMRLAARAIESTEDKEVRVLDRLDLSIRHEASREAEERRQAELAGERN